ncbi:MULTISPECIES: hypothetical protein [Cysteiniphilum]|uniref:hypothetical protein n=1 Tax=Cysteiniphilum TaxID=2056696 RepID=UPI00178534D1|nr:MULTISPECIES: hypothetical protein [Cysteiniphilum]
MFFSAKTKSKKNTKTNTTKQSSLKSRTISVIKWDKYHIEKYNKNSVNVLKSGNNSKKDTVISILPYLKRDVSNLGGFLA